MEEYPEEAACRAGCPIDVAACKSGSGVISDGCRRSRPEDLVDGQEPWSIATIPSST